MKNVKEDNRFEGVKIMVIVYLLLFIPVSMEFINVELAMAIIIASQSVILFKSAYIAYKAKNKKSILRNIFEALFVIGVASVYLII